MKFMWSFVGGLFLVLGLIFYGISPFIAGLISCSVISFLAALDYIINQDQ